MIALTRACGRALRSVFNPRMIAASVLPFLAAMLVWGVLLWFSWHGLVAATRAVLDALGIGGALHRLFVSLQLTGLDASIAPLLAGITLTLLVVLTVMALTAALAPVLVGGFFAKHRFPHLEARHGGTWLGSCWHGLWSLMIALVLLGCSMPFWLIPPLFAVLPVTIWGWLTARILTYDMMSHHASQAERRQVIREHRWSLLLMGIACTLLGALPTAVWALSLWTLALFPLIAAVMLWVYALVMVFSALWFGYFCLDALERLRARTAITPQGMGQFS